MAEDRRSGMGALALATRITVATLLVLLATASAAAAGFAREPASALPAIADAQLSKLLAQNDGKLVIVNFWASWCEPCRDEMPALQRFAEHWRERGVSVLTVAVADNAAASARFLREASVALPLLQDPELSIAHSCGVVMLPTTLVLDRRHRVVARARGPIDWDSAPVDHELQDLFK